MDLTSHVAYFVPAVQTLEAHSLFPKGLSCLYELTAESSSHLLPTASWFHGANHGDDVQYVLGYPLLEKTSINQDAVRTFSKQEHSFSLGMIKAWKNFAKSG